MKEVEKRYSKITKKFPREFVLLQGKGCFWKKCTFCDYFHDVSSDPFFTNFSVIKKVTGEFGILDVINSGSAMELDENTLNLLIKTVKEKSIKEIWFEVHWKYRNKLKEFAKKFDGVKVKFRTGIETFNSNLRESWHKGISSNVTANEIAKYFQSVCLLVGIKGQTLNDVISDIDMANRFFERFTISVFVKNSTSTEPDYNLINEFISKIYPKIKDDPKIDILINNTDLGVG